MGQIVGIENLTLLSVFCLISIKRRNQDRQLSCFSKTQTFILIFFLYMFSVKCMWLRLTHCWFWYVENKHLVFSSFFFSVQSIITVYILSFQGPFFSFDCLQFLNFLEREAFYTFLFLQKNISLKEKGGKCGVGGGFKY